MAFLLGLLFVAVIASLAVGAKPIPVGDVIAAFTAYDGLDTNHLIVRELRLPRTMVGIMVGVALGVAGAVMQAVTRNPLADPGILGVNAGASFAVVLAIWWFGVTSMMGLVWFAFVGAALASVVVYLLGSMGRGGATPVRMALAGAALSALLFSLTRAVTIIDQATLDQFRFWAVGSLSGRDADVVRSLIGFVAVGLVLAIGISRQLNALGLGEDTAAALGVKVGITRAISGVVDHAAVRRGGRRGRPDRLRRPRDPPRDARLVRAGSALAAPGVCARRPDPAARLRHHRAGHRPARRGAGRHHDRGDRWPGVRLPGPSDPDRAAVTPTDVDRRRRGHRALACVDRQ